MPKINIQLNRSGFTLAEILITIGVIGIVAAMTIPPLINNMQDAQFKTAYKKAYTMASQAFQRAYSNNELSVCDGWFDAPCNQANFDALKNGFDIMKDCGTDTAQCWDMSGEKPWQSQGGFPHTDVSAFIDKSGMAWSRMSNDVWVATQILVDTNGNKPPNQYGRDRVIFTIKNLAGDTVSSPRIRFEADQTNPLDPNQRDRCPSIDTRPCYYNSWMTGS